VTNPPSSAPVCESPQTQARGGKPPKLPRGGPSSTVAPLHKGRVGNLGGGQDVWGRA